MTSDDRPGEKFGCEHCWPSTADDAWEVRGALTHVAELIDESHFHVMILACHHCSQRFLSVFTETVDWVDSDDPQYWTTLPLTGAEAADLIRQRDSLTETKLDTLGAGRRCLRVNHPKATARHVFWGTGLSIGPHD